MATTTYDRLVDVGWSHDQAKMRAGIIERADTAMGMMARYSGLVDGDHVAVEYRGSSDHAYRLREGFVTDGRLTVGGGIPSTGMVGRVVSLPYAYSRSPNWQLVTSDYDRCTLANGEVLEKINVNGTTYWTANGERVNLVEYAAMVTPAEAVV